MPKTKKQKEDEVRDLKKTLSESKGFLVIGFQGVSVKDLIVFRSHIRKSDATLRVVKRRLLRITLEQVGMDFEVPGFVGQTGFITFSGELSGITSVVCKFAKTHNLTIFNGFSIDEGETIEADYISRIGQLPTRDELIAQVVGMVAAPLRGLLYILREIGKKVEG